MVPAPVLADETVALSKTVEVSVPLYVDNCVMKLRAVPRVAIKV